MALMAPKQAGAASLAEAYDCKPALHGGSGCHEGPERLNQQPATVGIHAAVMMKALGAHLIVAVMCGPPTVCMVHVSA